MGEKKKIQKKIIIMNQTRTICAMNDREKQKKTGMAVIRCDEEKITIMKNASLKTESNQQKKMKLSNTYSRIENKCKNHIIAEQNNEYREEKIIKNEKELLNDSKSIPKKENKKRKIIKSNTKKKTPKKKKKIIREISKL